MSRDDLHFRLRIPEDLKKQVEEAAEKHQRSMTAEINARLRVTFDQDHFMTHCSDYEDDDGHTQMTNAFLRHEDLLSECDGEVTYDALASRIDALEANLLAAYKGEPRDPDAPPASSIEEYGADGPDDIPPALSIDEYGDQSTSPTKETSSKEEESQPKQPGGRIGRDLSKFTS
ncbi:MAG: Arc family DNA-binding protein [Cohaesibacter sp.]|jgi:hypothetical protein|nr:Arc family DNA-binding protein [Cohaesibacter sp.]